MKYRIVRENKPTLKNYGRYKAVAMHFQTISSDQVALEIQDNCSLKKSDVKAVLTELQAVLLRHLRDGDRVRLEELGLLKLEIESEKVDRPEDFNSRRHIRGVRLHMIPESRRGKQVLYQDIRYERWRG